MAKGMEAREGMGMEGRKVKSMEGMARAAGAGAEVRKPCMRGRGRMTEVLWVRGTGRCMVAWVRDCSWALMRSTGWGGVSMD